MKAAEVNIIFTSDGPIRPYQPKYESTRIWVKKTGIYMYIFLRHYKTICTWNLTITED